MLKRTKLVVEPLESRTLLAIDAFGLLAQAPVASHSIDGTGNNLANPEWGGAGEDLLRLAEADYEDGISTPAGGDRPSAREISNELVDQDDDVISDRMLSAMIYAWGQFIDHDLDLTPNADPVDPFNVEVPAGDEFFDPGGTGTQTIKLNRSAFDPDTGTTTPREQINAITAWLDGSMIYGSDAATAAALRTFQGGKLKTSEGGLLPLNNSDFFPDGTLPMGNDAHRVPDDQLFAAGDIRANENVELTSLHTLFVREHNYWAGKIAAANPKLTDEQVYQKARAIVIAELQSITYNQWLPALLGRDALDDYEGYDPTVNPGIANEFSTAAFRLGHSLLGDDVEFLDSNGEEVGEEIPLSEAFSNPAVVSEFGIGPILKYLASDPSSELDNQVVESVRNFLFGPPGAGGLDLASLNIQRGRDHGLADYNSVREAVGLAPITSFADITPDAQKQAQLESLYGTVDNIDLWVGLLAEDHVRGSTVGETLRAIVSDQFERLRDGDRFWYENVFSGRALSQLENTTLADVIKRNTEIKNLQEDVFFFRANIGGTVFVDGDRDGRIDFRERVMPGATVEVADSASGEVIATTTTDGRGRYKFDVLDGIRTGDYEVRVVPGDGDRYVGTSRTVTITRGGQFFLAVNLGVSLPRRSGFASSADSRASTLSSLPLALAADTTSDTTDGAPTTGAMTGTLAVVDTVFSEHGGVAATRPLGRRR